MKNNRDLLIERLRAEVSNAYYESKNAIAILDRKDNANNPFEKETGAIAHILYASNRISTAESIYYSNLDILFEEEIQAIFSQFHAFFKTTLDNFSSDHPAQWNDINFNKIEKLIENSSLREIIDTHTES